MAGIRNFIHQLFPPPPDFVEKDLPDLYGKVYIVTGSNSGLGKELAQMLYSKNAKVYIAARSEEKSQKAIESIKVAAPHSTGELVFLRLDLADLTTIKATAQEFLNKEEKLDALFNNAGIGYPPKSSKSAQGYELQLGVNCVGPFMFTKLLTPILIETAKNALPNSVRVVWVSSSAAEGASPNGFMDNLDYHKDEASYKKYFLSKLGNYLHATEFAARYKADGMVSIPLNPGNLDSDFWRSISPILAWILRHTLLHPPIFGAYTALFSGFSPEITIKKTGQFVGPWGRFHQVPEEMINASKKRTEGGTGVARDFWEWSEAQVKSYL